MSEQKLRPVTSKKSLPPLVGFFSKLSGFIFNGYSHDKVYYLLPVNRLFLYSCSEEERSLLSGNGLKTTRIRGYREAFELLNRIDRILDRGPEPSDVERSGVTNIKALSGSIAVLRKMERIYRQSGGERVFEYIIHGSYGDQTFTAESDIDDVVFIRKNVYENYSDFLIAIKILGKLNRLYQQTDFTQHHGHWIFTYRDKSFYDESIMPCCVYEDSRSVGGTLSLRLRPTSSAIHFRSILGITISGLEADFEKLKSNRINLYDLKNLVSEVALIVPLVFQVNGEILSKKAAIASASQRFGPTSMEAIRWSSELREHWDRLRFYFVSQQIMRIASVIFRNRNLLDYFSRKSPLKLTRNEVWAFDRTVEVNLRAFIEEAKRHV